MLEKQYEYKLILTRASRSYEGQRLLAATRAEAFATTNEDADYRWGCSFYDEKGERIATIYLAGRGRHANINGSPMMSSGKLVRCVRQLCSGFE
jgi:hypothetical protein